MIAKSNAESTYEKLVMLVAEIMFNTGVQDTSVQWLQ
jgi:hypothetical protein